MSSQYRPLVGIVLSSNADVPVRPIAEHTGAKVGDIALTYTRANCCNLSGQAAKYNQSWTGLKRCYVWLSTLNQKIGRGL